MKRILSLLLILLTLFTLVPAAYAAPDATPEPSPEGAESAAPAPEDDDAAVPQEDEPRESAPQEGALSITLPEACAAYGYRLTDGYVNSRVSLRGGDAVALAFPAGQQGVLLKWYVSPGSYTVSTGGQDTAYAGTFLNQYVPLEAAVSDLTLTVDTDAALSEVILYGAEDDLAAAQQWNPSVEKADLMVIAGEPGAELGCFSGVLPAYGVGCQLNTVVVYVSTCGKRARAEEALDGLWRLGIRSYPLFGTFTSRNYDLIEILEEDWNAREVTAFLMEAIERFQPAVVVTHGADGEGALPTHVLTASCATAAVESASWKVPKFYRHEAGENAAVPDFSLPLACLNGQTALEAAQSALDLHISRRTYGRPVSTENAFTLLSTQVGPDESRDNLLEHLDETQLSSLVTPAPYAPIPEAPASDPEAAATEEPGEAAPTEAVTQAMAPAAAPSEGAKREKLRFPIGWAALGIGAALSLLLLTLLLRRAPGGSRRLLAAGISLTPMLIGLLMMIFLTKAGLSVSNLELAADGGPASAPSPAPTEALQLATPAPTEAPTPTPGETPIPASIMEDTFFRKEGDPAEVIVTDTEHAHWEYRTDTLDIRIDGVYTEFEGDPLAYFVAHIRMKDLEEFRPAFGTPGHTGRGRQFPWRMARQAKAVLWITGDNMINEERDEKGVLIRDGQLYSDLENEDTLALYPDLSLRIFPKFNTSAEFLLEEGVENTFSFGPTLVEDGVVNGKAKYHRIHRANPRTGIGMVEPGHFVAIVVDGRQKKSGYSAGLWIEDFAQLFVDYGCVTAYNLDGGLSAAMLFMGEQLNSHGNKRTGSDNDLSYQRSVPDGLVFGYSELVPTEDDPIFNDGNLAKE